jgi:hypothetical protein
MIELCSKKRMVLAVAILGLVSAIVIIVESTHLRSHEVDIHESHPILREKLTPVDKCWTREKVEVIEACHLCTKEEIFGHNPVVCIAKGYKEKLRCESGNITYRACHQVAWVEERKFWIFETVMFLTGCVSSGFVFLRQKQLDHIVYKRIQKQIATGV